MDSKVTIYRLSLTLCLLVVLGLFFFGYSGIGNIPFYLDDYTSVVNNPLFTHPIDYSEIWESNKARFLTYSALAFQFDLFGKTPTYFHYTSASIHVLVAFSVFVLVAQLSHIHNILGSQSTQKPLLLGGVTASIFLLHPQNTQAVVYIAQQAALWAALFSLFCLVSYIRFRTSTSNTASFLWGGICVLSMAFAAMSKQNAAVVPLMIIIIEWLFYRTYTKSYLTFGVISLAFVVGGAFFVGEGFRANLSLLDSLTRETTEISRVDYLATQSKVLAHYLAQFFYPVGLRLEYDSPIEEGWTATTYLFSLIHLVLLAVGLCLVKRLPIAAYGIFFYYVAHLIESSIFPIRDVAFEHRTYLPNVGLALAVASLGHAVIAKWSKGLLKHLGVFAFVAIIATSAALTHERVSLWNDQSAFYANEVKLSPNSVRANTGYGDELAEQGNCPLAIGYLRHGMALNANRHPSQLGVQPATVSNYIDCLRVLGIDDKAEVIEQSLLSQVSDPVYRSILLGKRGEYYLSKRNFTVADKALSEAVRLNKDSYPNVVNLAIVRVNLGDTRNAKFLLKHALVLKPGDEVSTQLLSKLQ